MWCKYAATFFTTASLSFVSSEIKPQHQPKRIGDTTTAVYSAMGADYSGFAFIDVGG
jgi:hypothetical protein